MYPADNFIWEDFNHGKYKLLTQNCQNFVKLLYSRIAAVDTDSEVSVAEKSLWHPVPDPASYKFVELSRISVVSGAVVGAGTAKVASLSTVAQAKGAISGKLAVAKIGLGSKAAGLGHVAVHAAGASKVAAIGGGMAKVGGAAALANPVAAAAMVGAGACLVYIAIKGNEDKKWTNRNKARKLLGLQTGTEEELSVGDVLEMEEELIDLEEKGELDLDENILTVVEELVIEGEKDMTESPELVHIDAEPVVQVDEALLDDNAALSDRISKIRSKVSARLASLQELVNNDGNPADRVDETAPDELVASKDRTSIISKVSDRVVPQLKTWAPKIQDLGSEGEIQPTESSDVVYLDSKSAIRVDEVALDEEPISSGRLSIKSKPSSERLSLRSKISTDQFSIKSKVSAKVASFQELLKNSDTNAVDQEDEAPLDEQIVQKDRLSIKSKVSAKVSPQLKRWKQLKT